MPVPVQDILRLGKGFRNNMINDKSNQMTEIVKDIEANIHKIPRSDQQDFRNKVLYLFKGLVEKKSLHVGSIDKKMSITWKLLKLP